MNAVLYEPLNVAVFCFLWNFINKIWNASRFVLMNVEGMTVADIDFSGEKSVADRWILARLNETVENIKATLVFCKSMKMIEI